MKTFLIDKINITNFKGLKGDITVNIDKPITIIYSQNATGKTSLIDAIEWVFSDNNKCSQFIQNKYTEKLPSVSLFLNNGKQIRKEIDSNKRIILKTNISNKPHNKRPIIFDKPFTFIPYNKFLAESDLINIFKIDDIVLNNFFLYSENYLNNKIKFLENRIAEIKKYKNTICEDIKKLKKLKTLFIKELLIMVNNDAINLYRKMQSISYYQEFNNINELISSDEVKYLSNTQNIIFNLALFLSLARIAGGSYFLDQPIDLLDGINKAAFIDIIRSLAIYNNFKNIRFVITTANRILVRQFREKLSLIKNNNEQIFRIYTIYGNPKIGTNIAERDKYVMNM